MCNKLCVAIALLIIGFFAVEGTAAALMVDAGLASQTNQPPVALQTGWRSLAWSSGNVPGPYEFEYEDVGADIAEGTVTMTLSAGNSIGGTETMCARDRGSASETFLLDDVYRDFVNPNNKVPMWLKFEGLIPGAAYDFKSYAFDKNNDGNVTFVQWNGSDIGTAASIDYKKSTAIASDTDPDCSSATLEGLFADSDGVLIMKFAGTSAPKVSGFILSRSSRRDPLDITVDFGDSKTSALATGALQYTYNERSIPCTNKYSNLTMYGSQGYVQIVLWPDTAGRNMIVRDRNDNGMSAYADVFSEYNLYRDAAISSQCATMWVEITGLLPKSKYSIVFCPYDWSYGRTYTVSEWTSGVQGSSGTFTEAKNYVFTADTPEDALTVKMRVEADATGRVLIRNSVASGESAVSWFRLSYLPKVPGLFIIVR